MRMLFTALLIAVPLAAVRADEAAESIIKKALAASGYDKIKSDNSTWKDVGTLSVQGASMEYTADWTVQRPDKYHFKATIKVGGMDLALTATLNGDKAWETDGKMTREVTGEKLDYMKNEMHLFNVLGLKPLLTDKTYELKALGESTVDDKKCRGVSVAKKGYATLSIYFDAETGLLHKSVGMVKDEFNGWKEAKDEAWYTGWKDENGRKVFTKLKVLRDGKPLLESTLSDAKEPEKVDAKLFEKP